MNISVVTTVYNRPEHLRVMLASLSAQTRAPDELIIADDGSDASTVAAMHALTEASRIPVRIVRQEKDGYRLAAARNLAIRAARGDYLLFVDCDMALMPDAVAMHEANARPGRLLCGHRALLDEASTGKLFSMRPSPGLCDWDDAWSHADTSELASASQLFDKHLRLRRWRLARPHKPKLIGCHFSLHRDDLARVNGFDENFVGWGYEDDDLARRLYKSGVVPFSVITSARAVHLWHPTLAPQSLKRHRDRPNRAYFRRWRVPAYCRNGLVKN